MVCVENEKWNYNRNTEEIKHDELEWTNNNKDIDTNRGSVDEHNNEPVNSINNASSSRIPKEAPQNSNQERTKRKPTWLKDYVTDKKLSEEEEETQPCNVHFS